MLSCMMACQMRHIGVSEDECLGHCDRNGQSGCRLTVNEETFNLCGPRDIRGSECAGPVSPSDCELGCHSYPEVTSRYERREMHCPNVEPIAQLGRLSTFEDCQAACDDRDDCGAIRILTRSRHPANNCLLYSNECNENRVDGPCTAIKECFYFERVFEATMCTLSGGEHVFDGWSGNDSGENSCNTCSCESGTLMCTEMACGPTTEEKKRLFPFVAYEYCSKSGAKDSRDYALTFGVHPASEQACEEFCSDWDECTAFSFWSRENGNKCLAFKECKELEHINMLQAKYVITRSSKPLFEFFSLKPFPFMASDSYCSVSHQKMNKNNWRDYVTTEGVSPPAEQTCAEFCSDWDECVAYSFWSLEKGNQCMAFKQCDHVTTSTVQAKYVMTRSSTPLLPEEETSSGKNRRLLQFHENFSN